MADVNTTLIPFAGPIASIMGTLKVLVGGVFGLYVILFIVKVREYVMLRTNLKRIRIELDALSAKVDALSAKQTRKRTKRKK